MSFNFGNKKTSAGAKSGEYSGWVGQDVYLEFCKITADKE